ncbi:MAG: N-6 DNA methylase [Bacteroidota bacterium]
MLDSTTKKNIDDCRDVLVGKVPDPKSQIEQITLALIYKFMDDMDKEVVEKFKGKPKFFVTPPKTGLKEIDDKLKGFEKYGWRKLFVPALNGTQVLELYSEALERLSINPNIPELFRNIFKNAYLPYRDPSTLKLFLKYINEFEYSHSEKLGDAFEYLLSVMGSQGDAGQFRTPRHIIDFVTACVNPQKHETVLDPACGTAGFLLSAYKHILNQNTEKRPGDKLNPSDRKKLATNFVGYDISPDMVRLSLANMYLHGFTTPKILEYDSLTSEDRWDETYDVILANPPFMTPKGGIRPHKKFGVQANKAEVLFTDYIAEHLTKNGRAGIVVPNGIVATSQTAYTQLRKNLVNDSLIAVISLPSGVFQPYSGVKTSVLLLDKQLAKQSKHILFLKVEKDGFDLGAQRREIEENDLPLALKTLEAFKDSLIKNEILTDLPNLATLVEKKKILENKDFVLNGDRYSHINRLESTFDLVRLKDICEVTSSKRIYQEEYVTDGTPFYRTKEVSELDRGKDITLELFISKARYKEIKQTFSVPQKGDILISAVGTIGVTWVIPDDREFYFKDGNLIWLKNIQRTNPNYLKHILKIYFKENVKDISGGSAYSALTIIRLKEIEVPLPSLAIQQQIVTEIESYQKIIDGAKQIVNNYKPTITINPDWEMVELGDIIDSLEAGVSVNSESRKADISEYGILKTSSVTYGIFNAEANKVILSTELKRAKCNPKKDSIIISRMNTEQLVGASAYIDKDYPNLFIPDRLWQTVISRKDVSVKFIHLIISSDSYRNKISDMCAGTSGSMKNITKGDMFALTIPFPPLNEQLEIVKCIQEEQALVNGNKLLIELFEQKIKNKIAEVWGVKKEVEKPEEELMVAAEAEVSYKKKLKSS